MTTSTHVYRAWLIADPDDVEMPVRGGTITLDVASAPHVTASITVDAPGVWEYVAVGYPEGLSLEFGYGEGEYGAGGYGGYGTEVIFTADEIALNALDPRLNARVRIDVEALTGFGVVTRSFNMGLRARSIQHRDATITLELSSDEALLGEWAPLTEDRTPYSLAGSLVDVVNYVLDEAIPGTALEAGAPDPDVTPYYELTNQHPNPAPFGTSNGYGAGGGAASVGYSATPAPCVIWTSSLSDSNLIVAGSTTAFRVTPGQSYVFAIEHAAEYSGRGSGVAIQWLNNGGASSMETVYGGSGVTLAGDAFSRRTMVATAPDGAEFAYPLLLTTGNVIPTFHYARQAMFYEGFEVVPYFDGATTDTAEYGYAWSDVALPDATSSVRTPLVDSPAPEALWWDAGQSGLEFLAPLIQREGLRLVCDELQQWTLRPEDFEADGSVSVRHAVNMTDADETISRGSGIWFDSAVARYTWTDAAGRERIVTDTYALDTPYTRLRLFEFETAYPGPGFAEYAVRRAQERGREINARAVSDWRVVAEQSVTIYLDDTPAQVGKTERVTFSLDDDEMTLSARTQDTPDGSIDLLEGTIDSLVGTINGL
jgi:hypothetical protein